MNKKKALFTSLAALALAATQAQTFADEVDATIAEPTVAEVPATEEVAQDAPVVEVVAEEPVVESLATDAIAEETVEEESVLATRAVEEAPSDEVSTLDAFLAGDFSEIAGTWGDANGDVFVITADGNGEHVFADGEIVNRPLLVNENAVSPTGTIAMGYQTVIDGIAIGPIIQYAKAGQLFNTYNVEDNSDTTRDRLYFSLSGYGGDADNVYYRVATVTEEVVSVEVAPTEPAAAPQAEQAVTEQNTSVSTVETSVSETAKVPVSVKTETAVVEETSTEVVTEAQPTTSEVVHVPLTTKVEETAAPAKPEKSAKPAYQRTEKAQSDKGFLPSTGEAVSILGILGAGLSALGLAGLKRRK